MSATATPFQTGRTEEIRLDVRDLAGDPLTGATGVQIRIQRASDGQFFDFDDSTFKTSGHTERDTALVQVDATLLPGIYELTGGFDSSAVTNIVTDDTYIVFPVKGTAPDTDSAVMPAPGEFKVGWYSDAIGLAAHVSATIGSAVPDTLELMAWLVRNGQPITTGLVGASVSIQDAIGTIIVGPGAMSGPNAAGVFTRSVPGVTLQISTNYIALLTITDASGAHTAYTAIPTLG
jgi:hypothetical protein